MAGTGGARPGAGRKVGEPNKRTQLAEADRERILSEGDSPLDVMIAGMRRAQDQAASVEAKIEAFAVEPANATPDMVKALAELHRAATGYLHAAHECAKDAAPYLHPRLATVDRTVGIKLPEIKTPADLVAAQVKVFEAIEAGEVTLDESVKLSNILEGRRKAFETAELEKRIAALEQDKSQGSRT